LAVTLSGGTEHCIYEINIVHSAAPKVIFKRKIFGPGTVSYQSRDDIFYSAIEKTS